MIKRSILNTTIICNPCMRGFNVPWLGVYIVFICFIFRRFSYFDSQFDLHMLHLYNNSQFTIPLNKIIGIGYSFYWGVSTVISYVYAFLESEGYQTIFLTGTHFLFLRVFYLFHMTFFVKMRDRWHDLASQTPKIVVIYIFHLILRVHKGI